MTANQFKTYFFANLTMKTVFECLQKQPKYWIQNQNQSVVAFSFDSQWNAYTKQDIKESYSFLEQQKGKLILSAYSYDLAYYLLNIPCKQINTNPLFCLRSFSNFLQTTKKGILAYYKDPYFLEYIHTILQQEPKTEKIKLNWTPTLEKKQYKKTINNIQEDIAKGLIYQLNYTQKYKVKKQGSNTAIFLQLLKQNIAPYASFWEEQDLSILSLSPESFLDINKNKVRTRPIKGTINKNETNALRKLWQSEKEQAELYMITDLMRNDLGQIAEVGSVTTFSLRKLKILSKIIHTYSIIDCQKKDSLSIHQALLSLLPAGSISGCPKKQAVYSIQEYENYNRSFYTGIMGYILPSQQAHFNILIRTLIEDPQGSYLFAGGGITHLSNADKEYQECEDKLASLQIN